MSRIIVKNLPRYVDECRLKEIFSSHGVITDISLKRTSDGKSRQFAFIGFKHEEEAQSAAKYFNKSFIDTQRVSVEIAKKIGEENMARPWSKHSTINFEKLDGKYSEKNNILYESKNEKIEKAEKSETKNEKDGKRLSLKNKKKQKDVFEEFKDDPQFKEFIQVMLPKASKKIWDNNDNNIYDTNDGSAYNHSNNNHENVIEINKIISNPISIKNKNEEKENVNTTNADSNIIDERNSDVDTTCEFGEMEKTSSNNVVKKTEKGKSNGISGNINHAGDTGAATDGDDDDGDNGSDDDYVNEIDDYVDGDGDAEVNISNLSDLEYLKSKVSYFSDDEVEEEAMSDEDLEGKVSNEKPKTTKGKKVKFEKQAERGVEEMKGVKKKKKVKSGKEENGEIETKEGEIDEEMKEIMSNEKQKKKDSNKKLIKESVEKKKKKENNANEILTDDATIADVDNDIENNNNDAVDDVRIHNQNEINFEQLKETGRLFVRNLSYTTTEDDLSELFEKFGKISNVHIVREAFTKMSKGFAYILFHNPEDSISALKELDGSFFQGRLLHIIPARTNENEKNKNDEGQNQVGLSKFKAEKDKKVKEKEENGFTKSWNSLFINPDTVARTISEKYGIDKGDLLNVHGSNDVAVKLSLAETHVIAETKKYFEDNDVDVSILENFATARESAQRSKKIILIKNLPFSATRNEIFSLFSRFGSIEKFIFPPTKALAIVEFSNSSEAKLAFASLAYKKFQHVPLYLEWAPEKLFSLPENQQSTGYKSEAKIEINNNQDNENFDLEKNLELQSFNAVESCTVYVKNLNFSTDEESLKKHFEKKLFVGSIRNVLIKRKKKIDGKELSMGFGFIEFISSKIANQVVNKFQGSFLDGHSLILELSYETKNAAEKRKIDEKSKINENEKMNDKKISTKLIVRNVAFEATRKDLFQLFNPFGQIKSLRLPKSFTGKHRGFAFVEFVSKQEAKNAFLALQNTHLYGRHLVLENANENESLDELRAKAVMQMQHLDASEKDKKKRKLLNEFEDFELENDHDSNGFQG